MVNRATNKGAARWRITGTPAVGNNLQAVLVLADPEGNGPFTYRWQSSSNGITWAPVGTNTPTYRITGRDQGKRLRLLTTYTDRKGHFETVSTAAGWVPAPPPVITLSLSSAAAMAEDGSGALLYTFKRTGPTTAPLTVNYTVGGTATLGTDYSGIPTTPATKSITFAAGSATAILTVDPTTDSSIEPNETVALKLAAGTGYTIGTSSAVVGTITNDDVPPPVISLAVSPASVPEDGPTNLIYTFSRTGSTAAALTVTYTVGGTATLGTDYTGIAATPATITFAPGSSTATLSVDPSTDSSIEPNETVELTLTAGAGYIIGTPAPAIGTITNDDDPPPVISLAVSPASVPEDGPNNLLYTFSRTGSTTSALTVNYTAGGTATLGTDYSGIPATPATKSITFAAGSATATVTVDPTADTTVEADETLALTLVAGSGYTIGTIGAVAGIIANDDVALQEITLGVSPASVAEDGPANLIYTFSRTGTTTSPLTVNYTVGGTATLGSDYTGLAGSPASITFAAGSTTATLTVDPTTDSSVEPDETVALSLAPGSGYTIGTATAVVGIITNDDVPPPPVISLAVSPASVPEDGPTNLIYTFSRTGATSSALTVNYTVGGTATLGSDYTGLAGSPASITFAAGSSTATLTVDPSTDSTVEPDETVALSLAAGTGYTIGTPAAAVGTITNDDVVIPSPPGAWTYDWASAPTLGNIPTILKASVAMPSPRAGEPPLALTALRVDLRDPAIQLTSTGRRFDWANNTIETTTETSRQFISRSRTGGLPIVAAMNTAPFDLNLANQLQSVPTNIRGFAVSEGQLVSSTDYNTDTFKSTFFYDPVTGARIENKASSLPAPAGVTYPAPASEVALASTLKVATSGFGIVLNNGVVSGDQVLQNARSALGLTADGRYLTLLTVDRVPNPAQPNGWQGATDYDVGTILKGFGSTMGINVDGGGSTQLAWWNSTSNQAELLSNPLFERYVGSSLGVLYQPS